MAVLMGLIEKHVAGDLQGLCVFRYGSIDAQNNSGAIYCMCRVIWRVAFFILFRRI